MLMWNIIFFFCLDNMTPLTETKMSYFFLEISRNILLSETSK